MFCYSISLLPVGYIHSTSILSSSPSPTPMPASSVQRTAPPPQAAAKLQTNIQSANKIFFPAPDCSLLLPHSCNARRRCLLSGKRLRAFLLLFLCNARRRCLLPLCNARRRCLLPLCNARLPIKHLHHPIFLPPTSHPLPFPFFLGKGGEKEEKKRGRRGEEGEAYRRLNISQLHISPS